MAQVLEGGSESEDELLARFQSALLELLWQPISPQEMARRMREDAAFAPFQDYVAGFEPRMIEVAAQLTRKWGRRGDGQG